MFLPANITLKFGDSGDFVTELQRRLTAVHCFSSEPNGFYDGLTVNAVSAFQSMSGIRADGIAGPETLRRLNGVISGDNSSANNHDEEQNRLRQEEMARQIAQQEAQARQAQHEQERLAEEQLAAEQARQAQQWQHGQAAQQPEVQYAQEAAYAPQQPQHDAQQISAEAMRAQLQQQMAQHQPAQPSPQAAIAVHPIQPIGQPAAQPQVEAQHPQQAPQLQPQAHAIPVHQPQAQHAPVQAAPQPAAAAAAQQHQPAAAIAATPAAEPAQKGIVGRAMQYANDMVQKLSAYFESKLPSPVIDQVKEIGMTMAKSGVREAAIPTGPEPQRGIEGPARGQQQQQARG